MKAIVGFVMACVLFCACSGESKKASVVARSSALTSSGTATLAEYWNGTARWKLVEQFPAYVGTHITIVDGVWYLFSRSVHPNDAGDDMGTEVRSSTDFGHTWSAPVEIIAPTPGTPWARAATDGDAYYDVERGTWHYLFQCLVPGGFWSGCHLVRESASPLGPFTTVQGQDNPVIRPGTLWNPICNTAAATGSLPADDCAIIPGDAGYVFDEGTFNIFQRVGGYYFVSFHGFDGLRGYRGIAKTADFTTWIAGDPAQGVPADAVFDRNDALGWRESWQGVNGPIGSGAGNILAEGDYYYMFLEAADTNLGCTEGQTWDWGLMRSRELTSTTWEQLPAGNPILYSSKEGRDPTLDAGTDDVLKCNPSYGRLFRDPSTSITYMHVTRSSHDWSHYGTFLYQLVPTSNLLANSDLWKCDTSGWQRFPEGPTNLVVYRQPALSSDEGCYLATNCGQGSCSPNQSFYQDVSVVAASSRSVAFGGKFAVDSGDGASLILTLHELGADSGLLASHSIPVAPTTTYAPVRREVTLNAATRTLRYQTYLLTPHTFRADEMFVDVLPPPPARQWSMTDNGVGHVTGTLGADGTWSANTAAHAAGYLQFGPYVRNVGVGTYAARWSLQVDNATADNLPVVRLEVYNATRQTIVATREVMRKEWVTTFQDQDFSLPFSLAADNSMWNDQLEFRVYWYRTSYVRESRVGLDLPTQRQWFMTDGGIGHLIGRQMGDGTWSANTAADAPGYFQFGPYTTGVGPGTHTAVWQLLVDNNTADDLTVVRLEVYDATRNAILATRAVTRKEWSSTFQYQRFEVPFSLPADGSYGQDSIELRVYWYQTSFVREAVVGLD